MISELFGLSATMLIVVGAFLLVAGIYGKKYLKKLTPFAVMAGILLAGIGGAIMVSNAQPAAEQQNILTPSATFNSVCSESGAHMTVQNTSHLVNVAMTYNTTSNAFVSSSNVAALNFTMSRGDGGITDAIAACNIGSVPVVGITGAASQPIIALNSDNSYNALFAKDGGFSQYEQLTVLVEAGSSAWMTVTLTANAAAVDGMTQYQVMQVPINMGGTIWTVNFQLVSITT